MSLKALLIYSNNQCIVLQTGFYNQLCMVKENRMEYLLDLKPHFYQQLPVKNPVAKSALNISEPHILSKHMSL